MRVTIFDYGAGNLHSLSRALASRETELKLEQDPSAAADTDVLILPGVGAFSAAARRLSAGRPAMRDAILNGLPCLGICLGMQLLFDGSEEGSGQGLGVIPGTATRLGTKRVPQIGWNAITAESDPLFDEAPLDSAYFANSFACNPVNEDCVIAWNTHEDKRFVAAVRVGNTVGVQFHPEKSSAAGVSFIRAFLGRARR